MANIIPVLIIIIILGSAIAYIVRSKKKGVQCIGCGTSCQCGGNCGETCDSCSTEKNDGDDK